MKLYTINPATEEKIKSYKSVRKAQVPKYVSKSRKAFAKWKMTDLSERNDIIKSIGRTLLKNKSEYSKIITAEMGKPIKESIAEIEKCALLCEYYSKNSYRFLKEEHVKTEYRKSYVRYEPLGVIAGIMPWNFPFWQFLRFAIPTIAAGNTTVLRHSTSVLGCSEELENLFKANAPKNIMQNIIGDVDVAESLISSNINGISFTGSTNVGRRIGELAGKDIKKVVLELGGSDPFVVLDDADIQLTCESGIRGRFLNTGQSCIAAKRFIVHKKRYAEFKDKMVELVSSLKVGDPMDESNSIGPLVSQRQLDNIQKQVSSSVSSGAKIEIGGKKINRKGYFFEPTVLTNVKVSSPAFREEIFGPVLSVIKAKNDKHAVELANMSEYGLGASIWSKDIRKAENYAKKIDAGNVFVNQVVRSDIRMPFGGVKNSGYGRELGSYGIKEFCNVKTIVVK